MVNRFTKTQTVAERNYENERDSKAISVVGWSYDNTQSDTS